MSAEKSKKASKGGPATTVPVVGSKRQISKITPYLLITPVQLLLLVVLVLPILGAAYLSFFKSSFGLIPQFVGWTNYERILSDPAFWSALWHTVVFVNVVVYGELLFALGTAVLFAGRFPLQRLWFSIVIAPYAVSSVIAVLMWSYILQPDFGFLNYLLGSLGLGQILWTVHPIQAFVIVAMIEIWLNAPFTFLILYSAIIGVPPELYEAAHTDGASDFQLFRHVTLPLIVPAMLVALMFRYIFALRAFDVVWIMTQGGPLGATELLSTYLFRHGFRYYEFGIASATGWIMVILTLFLAAFYLRSLYRGMFRHAA